MSIVAAVGALALLVLPAVAWRVGRRMPPREWARVVVACLVSGAVGLELALGLLAAPTVLRALGVRELAAACQRTVGNLAPGGPGIGWLATACAIVIPVLVARGIWRAVRARRGLHIEPALGAHQPFSSCDLVVLPTERLLAMTLPGRPAQVVVSRGLIESLSPDALDAVLRHEETHARCHHHRHVLVAATVDAGFGRLPLVRNSTAVLRLALERWADEDAATVSASGRDQVRDALAQVGTALLAHPAVAAFSTEATLVERLDALASPPEPPTLAQRLTVYGHAAVFATVAAAGLGLWISEARMMLAMSGLCRL
jgi:hypothetical protein